MAETRKDKRAPVALKVRFKSATVDEFIEQYAGDISRGGIFIKTKTPMAVGTLLKFDFQLKDESRLIHGVGRVVWRREPEEAGDELPAGMGIKFIKMDPKSRTLVEQIASSRDGAGHYDREGAADSLAPAAQSSGGSFFPDLPAAELPPPEDRTNVRHASEFLAEALSGVDSETAKEAEEKAAQARKRSEELAKAADEEAKAEAARKAEAAAHEAEAAAARAAQDAAQAAMDAMQAADVADTQSSPGISDPGVGSDEVTADEDDGRPAVGGPAAMKTGDQRRAPSLAPDDLLGRQPEDTSSSPLPMILVAAVVLIAGGFFYMQSQKPAEVPEAEPEATQQIASPDETPPSEPTVEEATPEDPPEAETLAGQVVEDTEDESDAPEPEVAPEPLPSSKVRFVTVPAGAELFFNGESLGKAPITASLPQGEGVRVSVRADGYEDAEVELNVKERNAQQQVRLKPIAYVILVTTEPDAARVSAAGRNVRSPGEIVLPRRPVRAVPMAIAKPGHVPIRKLVEVDAFAMRDGRMVADVSLTLKEAARPRPRPRPTPAPNDPDPAPAAGPEGTGPAETAPTAEKPPVEAPAGEATPPEAEPAPDAPSESPPAEPEAPSAVAPSTSPPIIVQPPTE